ncbi:MAG: hypothetical protein V4713_03770 [Pseudomonadota bacterium]
MNKAAMAMEDAIAYLRSAGFTLDGQTQVAQVRIPTKDSPVFGRSGGELATFGGRMRFVKAGTRIKATVGKRTTAIYEVQGAGIAGVRGIASFDTCEIEKLRAAVNAL